MGIWDRRINEAMAEKLFRNYYCPKCGDSMRVAGEQKDTLICVSCEYSMPRSEYGEEESEASEDEE